MALITAASVLNNGFGLVDTTLAVALDAFFILLWTGAQIVKAEHEAFYRS